MRKFGEITILAFILATLSSISPLLAVDVQDTRLLAQPSVSETRVAFLYAGDLWVARHDGSDVRRLTTHPGTVTHPVFSPDGQIIAFSAQYDGNTDVYVVPVAGGVPRRLTWHPGADLVQAFTPDGKAVLFTSAREVHTRRYTQLFTVSLEGGMPERLPIPFAARAVFSPEGDRIAYTPLPDPFRQWKNYRGGTTTRIWLYDRTTHAVQEIPQPEGRCNDTVPMWTTGGVYFLSDRDGEFNLYRFDTDSGAVVRLTDHQDFPILSAAAGHGLIAYEQAGWLHLFDPATGMTRRLTIGVPADLAETRPRFAGGDRWVRHGALSPSGARAAMEFRGEIVTVPAEKGDPRNITRTPAAHERTPAWSPDGTRIAYFSDEGGEYRLHIAPQDGRGEVVRHDLGGAGFYEQMAWSPDGSRIAFTDNSRTLAVIELSRGTVRRISQEPYYGPVNTLSFAWSPDSRWIAYTRITDAYMQQVHLYSVDQDRSHPVTDGLADVGEAVFDASGKYLYVAASTDAGPVRDWFSMSIADMRMTNTLYLVVLESGTPSPLAKQSDEEAAAAADADKPKDSPDKTAAKVTVDFDRLAERIVPMPVSGTFFRDLQSGAADQLYYLRTTAPQGSGGFGSGAATFALVRFDLAEGKETVLLETADSFALSADTKKLLIRSGSGWHIVDAGEKIDLAKNKLDLGAIAVRVDPRQEWEQIYHEAWRINRDYFYDPGMHGADWPALREKYARFLPHLATRQDLNRVIQWLCSELGVGHHHVFGGDVPEPPDTIPGGLLGADFEVDQGRYRFAKVYGGLNWNPELRSPLTEPGVEVTAGEYLLAVDGRELKAPENLYSRFEYTSGRLVELTVGPQASGKNARTVMVVPIEDEGALRNRDWVEGNIRRVTEATQGRVAYAYVPNTSTLGHTYFKRYFFPQAQREAIIVDERHNGGGSVADYYIDLLRRPTLAYWTTRYGNDIRTPLAAIPGPKVMLIDETAGSGGDLLPWMFRELDMGTLIGRRTWGGLVGVLGFPVLLDGGMVSAPNIGFWTEAGFIVENEGVAPDIEVEQWPAEVIQGRDPQLERAIAEVMRQLEADPVTRPERPPFPVRVR